MMYGFTDDPPGAGNQSPGRPPGGSEASHWVRQWRATMMRAFPDGALITGQWRASNPASLPRLQRLRAAVRLPAEPLHRSRINRSTESRARAGDTQVQRVLMTPLVEG